MMPRTPTAPLTDAERAQLKADQAPYIAHLPTVRTPAPGLELPRHIAIWRLHTEQALVALRRCGRDHVACVSAVARATPTLRAIAELAGQMAQLPRGKVPGYVDALLGDGWGRYTANSPDGYQTHHYAGELVLEIEQDFGRAAIFNLDRPTVGRKEAQDTFARCRTAHKYSAALLLAHHLRLMDAHILHQMPGDDASTRRYLMSWCQRQEGGFGHSLNRLATLLTSLARTHVAERDRAASERVSALTSHDVSAYLRADLGVRHPTTGKTIASAQDHHDRALTILRGAACLALSETGMDTHPLIDRSHHYTHTTWATGDAGSAGQDGRCAVCGAVVPEHKTLCGPCTHMVR